MSLILYDLAGADPELRFSPYCWRTVLALAHKDVAFETVPWRFTEKARIAPYKSEKVPVIVHDGHAVADSFAIAEYLEERFPDAPSLFEGVGGLAHARFVNAWADSVLVPAIGRMVVLDVWRIVAPEDRDYFRTSREARFGATLEEVVADREERLLAFRAALTPVRLVLRRQPWLGGASPSYADYSVFGPLQWARCSSGFELLAGDDPVAEWRERVMGLFGGIAGKAKTVSK
jgi:glutathione S-transferase